MNLSVLACGWRHQGCCTTRTLNVFGLIILAGWNWEFFIPFLGSKFSCDITVISQSPQLNPGHSYGHRNIIAISPFSPIIGQLFYLFTTSCQITVIILLPIIIFIVVDVMFYTCNVNYQHWLLSVELYHPNEILVFWFGSAVKGLLGKHDLNPSCDVIVTQTVTLVSCQL